jgi:NAD+ kinase
MSAGGPIVDPALEAMLLVPMSPYMLSSRPYLLNSASEVTVTLSSDKTALLVLDGQDQYEIGKNAEIIIRKAKEPAKFVDTGRTFFEKVEQKLRQH